MMHPYFQRMARYNQWANTRVYDACAALSDDERKRPRKSFFGSIHATLNHIMVGDRIWLSRIVPWDEPLVIPLNTELYTDFDELRRERVKQDEGIVAFIDSKDEDAIAGTVRYATTSGAPNEMSLGLILQHFFNHQTHHRGQLHDMLSRADADPPPLDLLYYAREVGAT